MLKSSFEDALEDILLKGGDADTNAAIVGGMMGALHGAAGIPDTLKAPVLRRSPESLGKKVEAHLCAGRVPELASQLYSKGDGQGSWK